MADSTTLSADTTTLVNSGKTTYISGTSGFDSSALIDAAVQKKLEPAYSLERQIADDEALVAAYDDLDSHLTGLQSSLAGLRNEPGSSATDSVFDTKTAYMSSSDGRDPANHLGVAVDSGTLNGSYGIEVLQLAQAHKVASDPVADPAAPLGMAGTFQLSAGTGVAVDMAVSADMSLSDIESEINRNADVSGVQASILQVSAVEAILVLSSVETGSQITYQHTGGSDVGALLGMTAPDGTYANTLQSPTNAVFNVDGVRVERSSNTISDALDGITLDIYSTAPGTTFKVDVDHSYADAKSAITDFVDVYNAYRDFVLPHQKVSASGVPADDAILFGDRNLRGASDAVYSGLTNTVQGATGEVGLGSLGLSFDSENRLVVDEAALDDMLLNNFDDVAKLFEFQFRSSSTDLQVLSHDSALPSGQHTLDLQVGAGGAITSVAVDGQSGLFTVNGNTIEGAAGSAYEGLKMVYTGGQSAALTFSISQGMGDELYDAIDTFTNDVDGTLTSAKESLEQGITEKESRIVTIEDRASSYERRLINYYASLEAKIAEAESMKSLLESIYGSDN